jgi:hypothetical protein
MPLLVGCYIQDSIHQHRLKVLLHHILLLLVVEAAAVLILAAAAVQAVC